MLAMFAPSVLECILLRVLTAQKTSDKAEGMGKCLTQLTQLWSAEWMDPPFTWQGFRLELAIGRAKALEIHSLWLFVEDMATVFQAASSEVDVPCVTF